MGKKPPFQWSFKTWSFLFEIGSGILVLLGMLALWMFLDAPQSVAPSPPPRREATQLGHEICDRSLYPAPWELRSDQLTILVNGFIEARLQLLQSSLRAYSTSPAVHSIFVLWSNTSTPDSVLQAVGFETFGAPIYVVRQTSTSLNDRFLPRQGVKTKAVMICDDDITVDSSNLEFALQVWRENQARIVGFFPRAHSFALDTQSWVYSKNQHKYSIMLTKVMILATEYLYRYWCDMPAGVREYVDHGMNCEDIAMNFLVSSSSGSGPLLVEGQPRDWGDSRNSGAQELTSMGLSARAGHRKDRGQCIRAFQRLWNGMQLHFSYAKAVRNVDEQVKCEKLGHLIDCDLSASSLRDVRRHAGHHLVNLTFKYAYVTLLQSKANFFAALVWAQAIRNTGSVHDLVLLLDANSGLRKEDDTLTQHFDVIKEVVGIETKNGEKSRLGGKLSAWQLHDYERVVFMDLRLLCVTNVDFLFGLREPAAAPLTSSSPQDFHTGLLVLQPSSTTFTALLEFWETMSAVERRLEHRLLNGFFSDWFFLSPEHRLPLRFNMPLHLSSVAQFSSSNESEPKVALPAVLRYPKRELLELQANWTKREESNQTGAFRHQEENQSSFGIWLEILAALRCNAYQPLDDDQIAHLSRKPSTSSSSSSWPPQQRRLNPKLQPRRLNPKPQPRRKAFATVLATVDDRDSVGGWIATFSRFHTGDHESLLLVHRSLDPQLWTPFEAFFDSVVVVDSLLHLWNQTRFDKLVYVDPRSLFLRSCDSFFEMEAFAAPPDLLLPDTFSLQVLVIQPDHGRFLELSTRYASVVAPTTTTTPMVRFLNEHHSDWYSASPKHRMEAVSNARGEGDVSKAWGEGDVSKAWGEGDVSKAWGEGDVSKAPYLDMDWKLFAFNSSSSFRYVGSEAALVWQRSVCGKPSAVVASLSQHFDLCTFFKAS